MNRVFSTGPKLIVGLILMLAAGTLMAQGNSAASYVKPGIDLSTYSKVMVRPLNMDNIEVMKPVWEEDDSDEWTLEIEDFKAIQEMFMDAMQKELETNGGYPMVSDPAADVLRIEIEILSITPYVKPGTPGNDGDFKIETLGSGDIVFSAEFRNSETRELLVLLEGERTIGDKYRKLSPENHMKNIKNLFEKWGKKVRESLDKEHNK